jgi:hypothetical protein
MEYQYKLVFLSLTNGIISEGVVIWSSTDKREKLQTLILVRKPAENQIKSVP